MNMKKHLNIHCAIQICLFFFLIILDQFTKYLAVHFLKDQQDVTVIEHFLKFHYLENSGAAFGIFYNRLWLFYVITVVVFVLLILVYLKIRSSLRSYIRLGADQIRPRTIRTFTGLSYILAVLGAGAIGNLIDRIIYGYVVDFIYLEFVKFPVFNIADICVTLSAIAIIILVLFFYKEDPNFTLFIKKRRKQGEQPKD